MFPRELQHIVKEYLIHPLQYVPAVYHHAVLPCKIHKTDDLKIMSQNNGTIIISTDEEFKVFKDNLFKSFSCKRYKLNNHKDIIGKTKLAKATLLRSPWIKQNNHHENMILTVTDDQKTIHLCNTKTNYQTSLLCPDAIAHNSLIFLIIQNSSSVVRDILKDAIKIKYAIKITDRGIIIVVTRKQVRFHNSLGMLINAFDLPKIFFSAAVFTTHDGTVIVTTNSRGNQGSIALVFQQEVVDGEFTLTATFPICKVKSCNHNQLLAITDIQYSMFFSIDSGRPAWRINPGALKILCTCPLETLDVLQKLLNELCNHETSTLKIFREFTPRHLEMLNRLPYLIRNQIFKYFNITNILDQHEPNIDSSNEKQRYSQEQQSMVQESPAIPSTVEELTQNLMDIELKDNDMSSSNASKKNDKHTSSSRKRK